MSDGLHARRAAGADADRDVAAAVGRHRWFAPVLKVMVLPSTVKDDPFARRRGQRVRVASRNQWVAAVIGDRRGQVVVDRGSGDGGVVAVPSRLVAVRAGDGGWTSRWTSSNNRSGVCSTWLAIDCALATRLCSEVMPVLAACSTCTPLPMPSSRLLMSLARLLRPCAVK